MLLHNKQTGTHEAIPVITSAMSRELHHAAQPLTVLQGTIELALSKARKQEEYQSALRQVMEYSQKLSDCFNRVQQLLRFQQPANDIADFSASALLRAVMESVRGHFITRGVELQSAATEESADDTVRSSEKRIASALELLLCGIAAISPAGQKVDILIDVKLQDVLMILHLGEGLSQLSRKASFVTDLELADAIVSSAAGKLTCAANGSSIVINLPKAPPNLAMHTAETVECLHV